MNEYFYPLQDNIYIICRGDNSTDLIGIWIFQSDNFHDGVDNTPVEIMPLDDDYNPFIPIISQSKFSHIEYIADIFP